MSSSVFYKFKNSREPERIVFDGTDITVFELKREIIIASGLGDGTDFDFHLYPEDDLKTEYDDDTTTISRSSTVVAVRRPAARGHGRAARYVSGKAPVRAIKKDNKPVAPVAGGALSEVDAEAAFLAESAQVWDAQKETLSHAKPVFHKKKPINVPTHEPPPGYVCYRCHQKGHWIQACPTNNDPDFKPTIRAKRTTGIPQSFLKKVEKPVDEEDARGVMMNADGEYVQVMTDNRTWEKFQEKANASKAQVASADAASKEIRERGLECPLDKRMFVNPVKTPCCGKTYCHECIDNALADGDLICPNCATEDVLMDDLVPDEDMVKSIKAYEAEKAKEKQEKLEKEEQAKAEAIAELKAAEQPASPPKNETESSVPVETSTTTTENDTSSVTVTADAASSVTPSAGGNASDTESTTSKKRKSPPTEIMPPTAPKAMRQQKEQESRQTVNPQAQMEQDFIQQMEALKNAPANMPMPMMGMPNMPNMPNMPTNMGNMGNMGFPNQMPFNNMGFNPMMNPMMGMPMHMQNMRQMPMHQNNPQMMGMNNGYGNNNMNGMNQQWQGGYGGFNNNNGGNGINGNGNGIGNGMVGFNNGMGMGAAGDFNDAYERQPVNPRGRHRKAARAPDYRHVQ
ncbi:DWNN-domain-containing protein [Pyrenochaeta sp. DS3sAY3a]|nr:DWNN-domain-containing protein [Pyrenochaeta sp. DS3sAY3a]